MSDCRDREIQFGCFTPTSGNPVTVKYVTVFDSAGRNIAEYYADDAGVTIDPATYLGGGVATLGACVARYITQRTPFCKTDIATGVRSPMYLVDYSDGTTAEIDIANDEDNWCECEC